MRDEISSPDGRGIAEKHLNFKVSWNDEKSGLSKLFFLVFYPEDNNVEMIDAKTRKFFLRRIKTDEVQLADLYLGNTITLLSRKLLLIEYGDSTTEEQVSKDKETTFGIIKSSSLRDLGCILEEIYNNNLIVSHARMVRLSSSIADIICKDSLGEADHPERVETFLQGPCLALALVGENAISKWRTGLGPDNLISAKEEFPSSIRARFAQHHDEIEPVAFAARTLSEARELMELFFPSSSYSSGNLLKSRAETEYQMKNSSTCCIILPHAVSERNVGTIVRSIQEAGFSILGLHTFHLDFGKAEEFLEVYRGVVDFYGSLVEELTSGMCIAMEIGEDPQTSGSLNISSSSECVVSKFREFVGPKDPKIARALRPSSLRARFGGDSVARGAVHCTDLPEDGQLEVEYFFKVLQ